MTESEGLCCKRDFFSYCSEVDVRNKVVILKIVAFFEFLPKWQMMKQDIQFPAVPVDITSFSLTPTMTTRPHKKD